MREHNKNKMENIKSGYTNEKIEKTENFEKTEKLNKHWKNKNDTW